MFYVGKSQKLFPTFFILLLSVSSVKAGGWNDLFDNLTGFPQIDQSWLAVSFFRKGYISFSTGYDDVYRKKINGKTTLTIAEQNNELRISLPFKTGQLHHFISGEFAENRIYFNNLNDETSLVSRLQVKNEGFAACWTITQKNNLMGIRLNRTQDTAPFTIEVNSFPQSEDSLTNQYFFNLLEPTFGRELTNSVNLRQDSFSVWGATGLGKRWRIGAIFDYADFSMNLQTRYVNSSPYTEFAGNRNIDLPVNGYKRVSQISLISPQTGLQELSLASYTDKFSYYIDNNRPNTKDKSSLGDGRFGRSGIAFVNKYKMNTWSFYGGLSVVNYNLNAKVNTPALGYYKIFVLNVQIIHAAEFNFSHSRSYSQRFGIEKHLQFKNFGLDIGSEYTHTLFDFHIKGTADLMCGITSTDLDYPFKYRLHLFDIHARVEWRKEPFGLVYTIRQLIPIGKRLDDSPIRFTSKTPGVDYTNRGGQHHQIVLAYYF